MQLIDVKVADDRVTLTKKYNKDTRTQNLSPSHQVGFLIALRTNMYCVCHDPVHPITTVNVSPFHHVSRQYSTWSVCHLYLPHSQLLSNYESCGCAANQS